MCTELPTRPYALCCLRNGAYRFGQPALHTCAYNAHLLTQVTASAESSCKMALRPAIHSSSLSLACLPISPFIISRGLTRMKDFIWMSLMDWSVTYDPRHGMHAVLTLRIILYYRLKLSFFLKDLCIEMSGTDQLSPCDNLASLIYLAHFMPLVRHINPLIPVM